VGRLTNFKNDARLFTNEIAQPQVTNDIAQPYTTSSGSNSDISYLLDGEKIFLDTARSFDAVTDKVRQHSYQEMYGQFLLPYAYKFPKMKILEIGLGCMIEYGPGASVALYKKLFPQAELWEAEYNAKCVEEHRDKSLKDVNVLVGDQGDPAVLDEWIKTSGGDFDIIIDDGGHSNCQIWTSFEKLWPTVKPGGLYFIEDMHAGRKEKYKKSTDYCDGTKVEVILELEKIIEVLIYKKNSKNNDVKFVACQRQACVIKKL